MTKLTMKALHGMFVELRTFVRWSVGAMAAVAVGSLIVGGVFVVNARHETRRTCEAVERVAHYLFVEAPRTRSLPARSPEEQARYEKARDDLLAGIAAACGG